MNLNHFFGLIIYGVFQKWSTMKNLQGHLCKNIEEAYQTNIFFCPVIWAKDGFNVSLQINRSNYCKSSEGSRRFSFHWEEVEFGYPENTTEESKNLLLEYSEDSNSCEIGRIPIQVIEKVISIHGGIDWHKTLKEAEKYIYSEFS
jgi:hypothetical protein